MERSCSFSARRRKKIAPEKIKILVKYKSESIWISISPETTIKNIRDLHQTDLTDAVLPPGKKLNFVFQGKVLEEDVTLRDLKVVNGSTIMLTIEPESCSSSSSIVHTQAPAAQSFINAIDKKSWKRWETTGVIPLSQWNLKVIPDEVWALERFISLLDLSHNAIEELPLKIGSLHIQKLLLNANKLTDKLISWEGLTSLKRLKILNLSQNNLTTLPSELCHLTLLEQLHVANNKLTTIPNEIGLLNQLEVFKANNNRIKTIPASIGDCRYLIEVDLSSNSLSKLPKTFQNLHNLKALHLDNNSSTIQELKATGFLRF